MSYTNAMRTAAKCLQFVGQAALLVLFSYVVLFLMFAVTP